jgi:1-acyl-sn-glycerol-3-phosphate acyltransferase
MTLLRSALFNLFFFGTTILLLPVGSVIRYAAPAKALAIPMLWARVVLGGLRVICRIRTEVRGREYLPSEGPALIASQHQSAFDTLVWLTLLPRCSYVVKRELARIPMFGGLLRPAGMIVVDRSAGASALRQLVRDARRAAAEGRQIVIFPEGTRGEPGRPQPLHPGIAAVAVRTGLPIIPVVTDSGRLWGRRAFSKRAGTIHVRVLEPIPATEKHEVVLQRLSAAFRRPVVDNSVG